MGLVKSCWKNPANHKKYLVDFMAMVNKKTSAMMADGKLT